MEAATALFRGEEFEQRHCFAPCIEQRQTGSCACTRQSSRVVNSTIDAQAALLLRILRGGSVDIVDGRMAVVAGIELSADEEALVRLISAA